MALYSCVRRWAILLAFFLECCQTPNYSIASCRRYFFTKEVGEWFEESASWAGVRPLFS